LSDSLDPISASEAARILSESRWNGEASEQAPPDNQKFGLAAELEQAGYEPMKMASPVETPEDEAFSKADILKSLAEQPAEPPVVVERQYQEMDGPNAGAPKPQTEVVSAEQAAHDLALARRGEAEARQTTADLELQQALDQLRQSEQQQQPEQAQEPVALDKQFPAQPAPEQPQAADDEVAKALSSPKVLAAIQDHINQATAQSNAMGQYYAQAVQQNAMAATAALVAQYPELQNLTPEQIPTAIKTVAVGNPERAAAMAQHIRQVSDVVGQHQKTLAAQQQAYQAQARQQFEQTAKSADADWENYSKANFTDEQSSEIRKEALAMLKEYGLSDRDIQFHYHNSELFRSFPAQRLMADAARWRLATRGAKEKAVKPVPVVQRPGSPLSRGSQEDYDTRELNARLDRSTGRDALKAAAQLVAARRARRG
jgi:hypothetical protein